MLRRAVLVPLAFAAVACAQDYDAFLGGSVSTSGAGASSTGGASGTGAAGAGTTGQGASTTTDPGGGGAGAGQGGSGPGGSGGQGGGIVTPEQAVAPLDGARCELPCGMYTASYACNATQATTTVTLGGSPATHYSVTLRVRGVVEHNGYVNGSPAGDVYVGGVADNGGWNEHRIDVSSPAQHLFLNPGGAGVLFCFAIDFTTTLEVDGGATVTLGVDAKDGQQVANIDAQGQPIVVPGIPPAPTAFEGQFFQVNVVSVVEL